MRLAGSKQVGFLENRRRRKAERIAQAAAAAQQRAAEAQQRATAAWEAERAELVDQLKRARTFKGVTHVEARQISVNLKKNERVIAVLKRCALIEPRRTPGHYAGGYSGFSFKIAKGVRYHTGGSRGIMSRVTNNPQRSTRAPSQSRTSESCSKARSKLASGRTRS
jgi:hypothetical protein